MIEKAGKMLVFSAGHPPIFGEQPLYFFDKVFNERVAIPEPQSSDRITDNDRVFRDEKGNRINISGLQISATDLKGSNK